MEKIKLRTPHELKQIVAQTAKALDIEKPGWQVFIDRDTLDMNTLGDCIYGQLDDHADIDDLVDFAEMITCKYDVNAYTAFALDTLSEETEEIEKLWAFEAFVRI